MIAHDRSTGSAPILAGIVTFNSAETIARCLDSLADAARLTPLEIVVLDNASTDRTVELVREEHPGVRLIRSSINLGFGAAHNRILAQSRAKRLLLLNPDAWLAPGALPSLAEALERDPRCALVAPRIDYPGGTPQLSFGSFPGWWTDWRQRSRTHALQRRRPDAVRRLQARLERPFRPDWISGCCFLARTDPLRSIGFFDERYFLYLEDVDLCRRLRSSGFHVRVEPRARCIHVEGVSHGVESTMRAHFRRSRLLYEKLHGSRLGAFLYGRLRAPREDRAG